MGEAVLTGRPILLSDFPGDSPHEVARQVSEELGVRSAMFVPLETKGRVIGVLLIFAHPKTIMVQTLRHGADLELRSE